MPGAEVVHTFVATMRPDADQTEAHSNNRATASSHNRLLERRDSVLQARRLTRCRFCRADEEPAAPRTLETPRPAGKGGPMNIRPRPGMDC